jgi:hypothetical protein
MSWRDMFGLDRDLPFQRCEWSFQRVGWLVIVAIVVAALSVLNHIQVAADWWNTR